ncbi:MAG: hypothetical protein EA365_14715 [Gloeocapsa sp. DLM2.Bin57]|nr:MAG: hypothetical protein EA365_14715 [Gloeocapsa sp. DLM2.Bin57]
MAGLFGLFGGKNKDNANGKNNTGSFFLEPDEAKTLGNLEYMRSSDKIRRTFPKTRTNQVTEIVKEVSSLEVSAPSNQSNRVNTPSTPVQSQSETQSQPESKPARRGNDSSLDLFRQMAKDIKK